MQTAEREPQTVRLPASFYKAKGRRRVVLVPLEHRSAAQSYVFSARIC
jgi:hypothetical protein